MIWIHQQQCGSLCGRRKDRGGGFNSCKCKCGWRDLDQDNELESSLTDPCCLCFSNTPSSRSVMRNKTFPNRGDKPLMPTHTGLPSELTDWWEKQSLLCLHSSPPPYSASYDLSSERGRDIEWSRGEERWGEERRRDERIGEEKHQLFWSN